MVKFYARHFYFWSNVAIYAHCVAFQLNFMVKFYAILAIYAILAEFYGQIYRQALLFLVKCCDLRTLCCILTFNVAIHALCRILAEFYGQVLCHFS